MFDKCEQILNQMVMKNFLFFVVMIAYITYQKRTENEQSAENVVLLLPCLRLQEVSNWKNRKFPIFNSFWWWYRFWYVGFWYAVFQKYYCDNYWNVRTRTVQSDLKFFFISNFELMTLSYIFDTSVTGSLVTRYGPKARLNTLLFLNW